MTWRSPLTALAVALALALAGCQDTDATQEAEQTATTERPNTVQQEAQGLAVVGGWAYCRMRDRARLR